MSLRPTTRRNLLFVCPSQGVWGGIEATVLSKAQWFHENTNYTVTLYFKITTGYPITANFVKCIEDSNVNYQIGRRSSLSLAKAVATADIVFAQNTPPDVAMLCYLMHIPLYLAVYNYRRPQGAVRSCLNSWALRQSRMCFYISSFVMDTWRQEAHGVPGYDILPMTDFPEAPPQYNQRKGFIFTSRLIKNKGLEFLLLAYKDANIDHAAWPLTIIGEGPLKPWAEKFIKENNLTSVTLKGFVTHEEKIALTMQAKWNVAPANTKEDLGLTPIESRFLYVPSIVSKDGGLPGAAGPHAILCEPGDTISLQAALEQAANLDETEYRERSEKSYQTVKKIVVDNHYYLNLFDNELADKNC